MSRMLIVLIFLTPVCIAMSQKKLRAYAKELHDEIINKLDAGVDPNAIDELGYSFLDHALCAQDIELVSYLISKGADVNKSNKRGYTPLAHAVYRSSPAMVTLLLGQGRALVNGRSTLCQYTPLYRAVEVDRRDMVAVLLANGADPNLSLDSAERPTPLFVASIRGYKDIAKLLIENGANQAYKNKHGKTAADLADTDIARRPYREAWAL